MKTGESVEVAAKYVPHFKPGKELRDQVDAAFAAPELVRSEAFDKHRAIATKGTTIGLKPRAPDYMFVTQNRFPKAPFRGFLFFWAMHVRGVRDLQNEIFPVTIDRGALIGSSNQKFRDYSSSRPTSGA